MSMHVHGKPRTSAAVAVVFGFAGTAFAAPVWHKDVPDTFQHQRWGLPVADGGMDPGGDKAWQRLGGWCAPASIVNQLYYYKKRGYTTFDDRPLPTNVTPLHDEVKAFRLDYLAAEGKFFKRTQSILNGRGAGEKNGVGEGLIAGIYKWSDGQVRYKSSDGTVKNTGKFTLMAQLVTVFKSKDVANARLRYDERHPAGPQKQLWWRGTHKNSFHSVTVAGYDTAGNGTLFFADPDSNPTGASAHGNRDSDAGWKRTDAIRKAAPTGDEAPPIKKRRFVEGTTPAGIPAPAGAVPTAEEISKLYYRATVDEGNVQFDIADANFDRYDDVQWHAIQTLEPVRLAKKNQQPAPFAALRDGPGTHETFEVSPGAADNSNLINEFWIFASNADEEIVEAEIADAGWNISIIDPGSDDIWGNFREFGGVYATTDGAGLAGLDLLEIDLWTSSGLGLSGWDFVYNDKFDLALESLSVQVFGEDAGFDLPFLQIPAPGTIGLIGLGLFGCIRRRR